MNVNGFTNLIGGARFKLAQNTNTNLQLELEETTKPLTEYDIIDIVNQNQVFLDEREKSKKYRFSGKFNLYTTNALSSGSTAYVSGKYNDTAWNPMFYGSPPVAPSNWVMQITYPSDSDFNFNVISRTTGGTMIANSQAYRGLQYSKLGATLINNDNYLTISGVQKHNLIEGDYVYLYSYNSYNSLQGVYRIKNLGINGENFTKDLTLDTIVDPTLIPTNVGNFVRMYEPSDNDINFNSPSTFILATATDISGGTTGSFSVGETIYSKIKTPTPHNLSVNDFIEIRTGSANSLNGVWRVYCVIGGSGSTQFVIRTSPSLSPITKGTNINYSTPYPNWRRLDATPSEYYVRKFEVITSNQYSVYPCTYSSNIYPDVSDITLGTVNNTWLFQFDQDVDIQNLITNRNGPISEVYYTVTKRAGKNPFEWSHVTADWDFNYQTIDTNYLSGNAIELISEYNVNGIGTIEKSTPRIETINLSGDVITTPGSKYIGDFIDYNSAELLERPVSDIVHRFGNNANANGNGYYYKPFKKLTLRKYSLDIETAESDDNIVNIPGNYETYSDGSIAWRDLLTEGYFEEGYNGVDYPFLNTAHYIYFNYNLYVRTQLPVEIIDQSGVNYVINLVQEC